MILRRIFASLSLAIRRRLYLPSSRVTISIGTLIFPIGVGNIPTPRKSATRVRLNEAERISCTRVSSSFLRKRVG